MIHLVLNGRCQFDYTVTGETICNAANVYSCGGIHNAPDKQNGTGLGIPD